MSKFKEYLNKTNNVINENSSNEEKFNEWNGFKKGQLVHGYPSNTIIWEIEYFEFPSYRKAQGSKTPVVYCTQRYSPNFSASKKLKSNFDAAYLKKIDKSKLSELIENIKTILKEL